MPLFLSFQEIVRIFISLLLCLRELTRSYSLFFTNELIHWPISEFPKSWHKRKAYPKPLLVQYKDEHGSAKSDFVDVYYGSQWMMLTPEFVTYMGVSLRDPDSFPSKLKEVRSRCAYTMRLARNWCDGICLANLLVLETFALLVLDAVHDQEWLCCH